MKAEDFLYYDFDEPWFPMLKEENPSVKSGFSLILQNLNNNTTVSIIDDGSSLVIAQEGIEHRILFMTSSDSDMTIDELIMAIEDDLNRLAFP